MDEYTTEIGELQAQVDAMIEAEADPKEIAELQLQLQILRTLYRHAERLFEAGLGNADLRRQLVLRGYGDWTLDNVYAFVYETAVDMPIDEPGSFLGEIRDTDFERILAASVP